MQRLCIWCFNPTQSQGSTLCDACQAKQHAAKGETRESITANLDDVAALARGLAAACDAIAGRVML